MLQKSRAHRFGLEPLKTVVETTPSPGDAPPEHSVAWAVWLSEQEEIAKSVYLINPNLLIADFSRER